MSYFAIHVKTGWENFTVNQIKKSIKENLVTGIASIIAPVLEIKKFVGQDVVISKKKMLCDSYIFIKTEMSSLEIPVKIYHFLKEMASTIKVLPHNIPETEIEAFCYNYELALEEAEINVQLEEGTTVSTEQLEKEKALLLHRANTTKDRDVRQELIQQYQHSERTIDQFNRIICKENASHLARKCRAYIQGKKETFSLPLALFVKTLQRIDPHRKLTNKELTKASFILPKLLNTLQTEVNPVG